MTDAKRIKDYILYLKNQCGLSLTLHPTKKENLILPSELIALNIHDNSYCVYVKTSQSAQEHCISRQCRVFEKASEGSYCGTCYAGVREYVYPIENAEEAVGFISVSGYRCDDPRGYLERTAEEFSLPLDRLKDAYSSLKSDMPEKRYVDTLIYPLLAMIKLAYMECEEEKDETFINAIVRYIKQNHTQNITLDHVCKHFGCNRSKVSHSFKSQTGKSFREYLTELRLADAKALLRYSDLSVTEISYSVGFCDSNYFSGVFKKWYGISPKEYRKKHSAK